ncbi:MAG: hypothetical protein U9Q83_08740, partial [Bacteroidota bacterium]|nr:hypothetical protein [Bacteroidota bacterium]
MKTKIILSIFFSIFFLVSCQEEIPLNLPDAEQLIVVNGVLMTDSTLSVNISKSINISNTDDFLPRI